MLKNSYFIDSCIFLGILRKDENTRSCKSFISRVNNGIYKGYISPYVTLVSKYMLGGIDDSFVHDLKGTIIIK